MSRFAPHPFTLRQLQYVVAIADGGSFRAAATACAVSQPALSTQVAQLEEALGVRLFERDRRSVRLTEAGAALLVRARALLVGADDLVDAAAALGDPLAGTLRLGVIPTVAPYLLPELSAALRRALPQLHVAWTEEKTPRLVEAMARGELDGAVAALESQLGDVESSSIGRDPFLLAAAPHHPLARGKGPLRADKLVDADVLLLDDGHCLREQVLAVCEDAGAREKTIFRATSLPTLLQMVAAGDGVTLLPRLAAAVENRRRTLALRPFAAPTPGRTIALVWRRGSARARSLHAVAEVLRARYAKLDGRAA